MLRATSPRIQLRLVPAIECLVEVSHLGLIRTDFGDRLVSSQDGGLFLMDLALDVERLTKEILRRFEY